LNLELRQGLLNVFVNFEFHASRVKILAFCDDNLYVCGTHLRVVIIGNLFFQLPFTLIEVNICHNEQCLKQHVRVAAKPALYPSSQLRGNQSTAENVSQSTTQGPPQQAVIACPVSMANRPGREEETMDKLEKRKNIVVSSKSSLTHLKRKLVYVMSKLFRTCHVRICP
jgi:hypothetical protein